MEVINPEPYLLLDAGDGQKVEQIGSFKTMRQAAQAHWPAQSSSLWQDPDAIHHRSRSGGGSWSFQRKLPKSWPVTWGGLKFWIKLTDFGHIGMFPEQAENWDWIRAQCKTERPRVLNLFGYTGGSSLAAASAGAEVTHVDASKGVVSWGRDNQSLNELDDKTIRWIVEDCTKYMQRERRRGSFYQGLILDPPSFGRGPNGQAWKIEEALIPLLLEAKAIMKPLAFVLLSCHTPGFTGLSLANVLNAVFDLPLGSIENGEMVVEMANSERVLPSGTYARWSA